MCTLTIFPQLQGFVVTMNRDEVRHRQEAGLKQSQTDDVSFVYPVDAEAGGSWIGMNDQGVAMALLNRYQAPTINNAKTRGAIIPSILPHSPVRAVEALKSLDPSAYNPFDCLLVTPQGCFHYSWNRDTVNWRQCDVDGGFMMTSSSERWHEVRDYREKQFNQWRGQGAGVDASAISQFHLAQNKTMASSATLVNREFVHTKSVVQIVVDNRAVTLDYFDQHQLVPNVSLDMLTPTDSVNFPLSNK